jgi:malonyl CoA-acyl carrier protein transacylase
VQEYERKQLLERIDRESSTLGVEIPERIEIQGEEVRLREFVFEIKRRETVPAGERDRVERAKRNLRRERLERKERIEENEVSFEAGEELAEAIVGIDRALEALESLKPESVEAEAKRQETADTKRWMDFLKKALGHDDDGPQVRGP